MNTIKEISNFLLIAFSTIVMVFVLTFVVYFPFTFHEQWVCSNFEDVTGRQTRYIRFDGCYVKNKQGEFIRYDRYYKE